MWQTILNWLQAGYNKEMMQELTNPKPKAVIYNKN